MKTFLSLILGNMPFAVFFAALFFALIGLTINLLIDATTRRPDTQDTPLHFSPWFLIRDNWKRIVLSFLLIVVTLRFTPEITGFQLNMFVALCIGFVFDKLSEVIKSKADILKVSRDS